MKYWLVATYKTNEVKRLLRNLMNQRFDYYLPKITTKKNSNTKEVLLFPGYIFVYTGLKNYSALKYTIGIKNIIKFGNSVSTISSEEIKSIKMTEQISKRDPITSHIQIGQEVTIKEGSLKGNIVKICELPSKDRVSVLLNFLGSTRKITIQEENLIF